MRRLECLALLAAGDAQAAAAPLLVRQWRQMACSIDGTESAAALHLSSGFQAA
jgi:hypothetical protein